MKITVGSPKPAIACSISSTPVAHNERAVPIAMIATGTRFDTNSTTTAPSTMKVIVLSDTLGTLGHPGTATNTRIG